MNRVFPHFLKRACPVANTAQSGFLSCSDSYQLFVMLLFPLCLVLIVGSKSWLDNNVCSCFIVL